MKLQEAFFDMYKAPIYALHLGEYTVYKDPTKKEIDSIIKESTFPALRFVANPDKKEVYIFPSDIMHEIVAKKVYSSKPRYLLFGIGEKDSGETKAKFGQIWGTDVKSGTYYESVLRADWSWLEKYFNMAPLFETVMRRYKNS